MGGAPLATKVDQHEAGAAGAGGAEQCSRNSAGWYGETAVYGSYLGYTMAESAEACCGLAGANSSVGGWMYENAGLFKKEGRYFRAPTMLRWNAGTQPAARTLER